MGNRPHDVILNLFNYMWKIKFDRIHGKKMIQINETYSASFSDAARA
jgi:hypothetical protein